MTGSSRLYMFDGGAIRLPLRNSVFGRGNDGETITTPVPWFLVTHDRGNVIIDGGNAPEVAIDAKAHWGALTEHSTALMTPDQAALPGLERIGVDPTSIRWIVQSHLHLDHTGAVAVIHHFPNAQVLVSRTQFEWAHDPTAFDAQGFCKADYVKPGIDWVLLEDTEDGWDLFGDGTIVCWHTPGHTPGHMSIEIGLSSGTTYLLTADAANSMAHYRGEVLPGFLISATDTVRSVKKLQRIAWRSQAVVVAGHDPEQWPTFKKAPEYYD